MISSPLRMIRRYWNGLSQRPFGQLVRLFVGRIFHGSGEGDLDLSLGLLLSLLALPGAFYSVLLFEKYATLLQWMRGQSNSDPLVGALPDEYFLIVLSMVVTGLAAVWRWDSILPDRRDYANLVHLPISTPRIFLANLAAILLLALVLALDTNAASAVLFPLAVTASAQAFGFFAEFAAVHVVVVLLASIFSFFAVFVIVGVLMVTLPYSAFRRVSIYVRAALMACLVALLATSFAVPSMVKVLPASSIRFLPPVWFLGLCQLMRGRAVHSLAMLGCLSLIATGGVVIAAVASYALSYRRCFARIPETTATNSSNASARFSWIFRTLDRTVLNTPFQRAGYRFVIKTLFRSEQHGLILGGFVGLGIVIASQFLFASFRGGPIQAGELPSPEILAVPLVLGYCVVLGVRFAFEIPTDVRANWIFRLSLDKATTECVPLAWKVMLTFVLPWAALVAPLYGYLWGWQAGLLQATIVPLWSFLLAKILLLRFRKVPFTCSYPPFRDSAVMLVVTHVLGFFAFIILTSNLEYWALLDPVWMASFPVIALAAWHVLWRLRRAVEEVDRDLIFEDNAREAFVLIDLSNRT